MVFFGSISHADLLKSVARRIVDRRVLHLIKMWLECPVEETDQRGRTRLSQHLRVLLRAAIEAMWREALGGMAATIDKEQEE